MSSSAILRAAFRRWYITVPGVLLSLIITGAVFSSMTPKYTSSGIAVLVRPSNPIIASSINPALGNDGSFTTTTLTLEQALDTPTVKAELGLREGVDNFTISNVDATSAAVGGDHPFLYVTTQSSDPQKATEIVADVIAAAGQKLTELQNSFNVRPQNQIKVEGIVDATPPKAVRNTLLTVTGAVLLLGIATTCIVAFTWDKIIAAAQERRRLHRPVSRANADTRAVQSHLKGRGETSVQPPSVENAPHGVPGYAPEE